MAVCNEFWVFVGVIGIQKTYSPHRFNSHLQPMVLSSLAFQPASIHPGIEEDLIYTSVHQAFRFDLVAVAKASLVGGSLFFQTTQRTV